MGVRRKRVVFGEEGPGAAVEGHRWSGRGVLGEHIAAQLDARISAEQQMVDVSF